MANNEVRVLNPGEEGELRGRWRVNKGKEEERREGRGKKKGREGAKGWMTASAILIFSRKSYTPYWHHQHTPIAWTGRHVATGSGSSEATEHISSSTQILRIILILT